MSSFPELIDVGIMGHCIHGKTGLCLQAGIECYQDGLHATSPNMALEDFRHIAAQCRGRTYQFALGGCGDPDQHESFGEVLRVCSDNAIVPNFTTSGFGMSDEVAELCARHCGAVAVSWYRSDYTIRAIRILLAHGVKTNVHYVLTRHSMREAIERLSSHGFPTGINAVVFLLHKPVGLGTTDLMVDVGNNDLRELLDLIDTGKFPHRIGFDSCTVPAIIRRSKTIDPSSIDTCEGARWSAYITPDLKMLPCSFDNQELRWAVDLRTHSIEEAWMSPAFEDFRNRLRHSCPTCPDRDRCMGGCPIRPEIVLCDDKHRVCCTTRQARR